jgi:hypothetical protein
MVHGPKTNLPFALKLTGPSQRFPYTSESRVFVHPRIDGVFHNVRFDQIEKPFKIKLILRTARPNTPIALNYVNLILSGSRPSTSR